MSDAAPFFSFYVLGLIIASVVHEGGHLAMGSLLQCDPRIICIGVGPNIARFRCSGVWVVFRLMPIGGYVLLPPRPRERRVASFLITAAGPAANLIAAAVLWSAFDRLPDPLGFTWLGGELLVVGMTVLPYTPKLNGFRVQSDGKKMLAFLLRRDRDVIADAYARVAKVSGSEAPPERTPGFSEIVLQASRSDRREAWGRRQAIEALAALLARGTLNPMETEFAKQLIYEHVDAEQAKFREDRKMRSDSRRRTWRCALASVREAWRGS